MAVPAKISMRFRQGECAGLRSKVAVGVVALESAAIHQRKGDQT
jgi:hypothetical protein